MTTAWKLRVTLRSPFLIPGVSASATVADAVPAVNADGKPIIPGSLMRGLFRDAVQTAFGEGKRDALFGRESGDKQERADYEPHRRVLEFSDLVGDRCGNKPQFARVSIDPDTGAAKEGHLQFIELTAPPNCLTVFEGTVICSDAAAKDAEATLDKAKKLIRAVGSHKSAGFGEAREIILTPKDAVNPTAAAKVDKEFRNWVEARFELDRPFLVDSEHSTANRFRGAAVIPGAVFKGALARALGDDAAAWLTATHIGHAHPAPKGGDPYPTLPFSLALIGEQPVDMLHEDKDGVPIFETDWKDKDRKAIYKALDMEGEPFVPRDVRVRTAMNYESGVVAYKIDPETKEGAGQLFSHDAVVPGERQWVARWLLDGDSSYADKAAAILRAGLPGIGKTRAVATAVGFTAVNEPELRTDENGCFTLTLLTDAALGLDYPAYWKALGFELVDHFAKQRLAGGYQAKRYPIEPGKYRPYVLTRAGSVFKIKPDKGGDAATAAEWLKKGLPPVAPFDKKNWKEFPFGRENGFGAVTAERLSFNDKQG